jgi:hypothetical protein
MGKQMARRKSVFWPRWVAAFGLTMAYIAAVVSAIPFIGVLSKSPPWGWLMMFAMIYMAFAALSLVLQVWGIQLKKRILFIPF